MNQSRLRDILYNYCIKIKFESVLTPKYSIIVPTKNRAYCIWRAILSIVNQSFKDWELLVIDGGSSDETEKLVNEFDDKRIRFIPNPDDTGVASARNKGIKESNGYFIGYLDSDDFVYLNWLAEMDKYIKRQPRKVLFMPNKLFTLKLVDDSNNTVKIFSQEKLFTKPIFSAKSIINLKVQCDTNGMIHSKESIQKVGLWNTNLSLYEDFEYLLRFVEYYPKGICFVPKKLVAYTRAYGKDSLCSSATYNKLVRNIEIIYKLHGHKKFLKKQTWYPQLRDKYKTMSESEKKTGHGILDHIIEKYSISP